MSTDNFVQALRRLDTCAVSDALDRLDLPGAVLGISALSTPKRIAGRVSTVSVGPRTDESPRRHLATSAVDAAGPEEVIVIANMARCDVSAWGGILSLAASRRGVQGVIVDGACRDLDDALDIGFPVYARTAVPVTARGRLMELSAGQEIEVGGVAVLAGDYVIADRSGVVFCPASSIGEVLTIATSLFEVESEMASKVRDGQLVTEVMHDAQFG